MGWATIVPRGCGERRGGGIYVECGTGPGGMPLEHFLIDSPLPIPDGLDIINKAQLWQDPKTGVYHLVIWIGASHYPYVSDYIEEVRRFGASRRISGSVDISKLTPGVSGMILAHPRCRIEGWMDMAQPMRCNKHIEGHAAGDGATPAGPCLFKCYELVPAAAGVAMVAAIPGDVAERPTFMRQHVSTAYHYHPTGESGLTLQPGIFAMLPLHGFGLVKYSDGSVDEARARKLESSGMPWYAADK